MLEPNPDPNTEIDTDPVVGEFVLGKARRMELSKEKLFRKDDIIPSMVNVESSASNVPEDNLHNTDESELHEVDSHEVPPILVVPVMSNHPKPVPKNVTGAPPAPGPFGYLRPLICGTSNVKAFVKVTTPTPTVTTAALGKSSPLALMQRSWLSEVHWVDSQAVPPPT